MMALFKPVPDAKCFAQHSKKEERGCVINFFGGGWDRLLCMLYDYRGKGGGEGKRERERGREREEKEKGERERERAGERGNSIVG